MTDADVYGLSIHGIAVTPVGFDSPWVYGLDSRVLYGKNGAGKTRLLDAVGGLGGPTPGAARCDVLVARTDRERASAIRRLDAPLEYELDMGLEEWLEDSEAEPTVRGFVAGRAECWLLSWGAPPAVAAAVAEQRLWVLSREQQWGDFSDVFSINVGVLWTPELAAACEESGFELEPEPARVPEASPVFDAAPRAGVEGAPVLKVLAVAPRRPDKADRIRAALLEARRESLAHEEWVPWTAVRLPAGDLPPRIETAIIRDALGLVHVTPDATGLEYIRPWFTQMAEETSLVRVKEKLSLDPELLRTLADISRGANDLLEDWLPDLTVHLQAGFSVQNGLVLSVSAQVKDVDDLLPFEVLSVGERRLAVIAISMAAARELEGKKALCLVVDEPDAALHPTARRGLARALGDLRLNDGWSFLVSTHSNELLDIDHVHRSLVERWQGVSRVSELQLDDAELIEEYGLDKSQYLAAGRTFLLVEGAHDEALLRAWLGPQLTEARVEIMVLRGTSRIGGLVEAQNLWRWRPARIVIALDNLSEDIQELAERLLGLPLERRLDESSRAREAVKKQRGRSVITDEEEKVLALVGHLPDEYSRVTSFFGYPTRDILELLPLDALAPGAAGMTWDDVNVRCRNQTEVKDFLRSKGARLRPAVLRRLAAEHPVPPVVQALARQLVTGERRQPDGAQR